MVNVPPATKLHRALFRHSGKYVRYLQRRTLLAKSKMHGRCTFSKSIGHRSSFAESIRDGPHTVLGVAQRRIAGPSRFHRIPFVNRCWIVVVLFSTRTGAWIVINVEVKMFRERWGTMVMTNTHEMRNGTLLRRKIRGLRWRKQKERSVNKLHQGRRELRLRLIAERSLQSSWSTSAEQWRIIGRAQRLMGLSFS